MRLTLSETYKVKVERKKKAEEMGGEKRDTMKCGSFSVLRVLKTFTHPFGMDRQSLLQ